MAICPRRAWAVYLHGARAGVRRDHCGIQQPGVRANHGRRRRVLVSYGDVAQRFQWGCGGWGAMRGGRTGER